jgi:hypothetical protein
MSHLIPAPSDLVYFKANLKNSNDQATPLEKCLPIWALVTYDAVGN